jgi:hypothetical protein
MENSYPRWITFRGSRSDARKRGAVHGWPVEPVRQFQCEVRHPLLSSARMNRYFVTGAAGFIGARVCELLAEAGGSNTFQVIRRTYPRRGRISLGRANSSDGSPVWNVRKGSESWSGGTARTGSGRARSRRREERSEASDEEHLLIWPRFRRLGFEFFWVSLGQAAVELALGLTPAMPAQETRLSPLSSDWDDSA